MPRITGSGQLRHQILELSLHGNQDPVNFVMQVAKSIYLSIMSCANFHFLLHYVITIHQC